MDRLYRVAPGGVEISGNQSVSIEELKPFIKLTAGEPFISARLDALASAIKQVYQRRGFATVTVNSGVNEVGEACRQADDRGRGRSAGARRQRRRSRGPTR